MLLKKRNMCTLNTGTAVDKRREDFTVITAYSLNWKPSNRDRQTHAQTHTHIHTVNTFPISVSVSTV